MNKNRWRLKIYLLAIICGVLLAKPQSARAGCWISDPGDPYAVNCSTFWTSCNDICKTESATESHGISHQACGTYCWARDPDTDKCISWGDGCYWQGYDCDTSCAAATPPGACFVPGTMVANKSGGKAIEDIQVGDSVTSFEGDKIVNSSVSQIYKTQRDYYFEIVAGEYGVSVTAEHPFYIGDGKYEETQNLKVGDTLYVQEDGEMRPKTIDMIRRVDEKTDVYNMTVDGTHTYFADGFAVHNKTSYVGPTCASGTVRSCDYVNPAYMFSYFPEQRETSVGATRPKGAGYTILMKGRPYVKITPAQNYQPTLSCRVKPP